MTLLSKELYSLVSGRKVPHETTNTRNSAKWGIQHPKARKSAAGVTKDSERSVREGEDALLNSKDGEQLLSLHRSN